MTHTHHELAELMPEYADDIHKLKMSDSHFARLADEYHEINRQVHRMETNVEPASDEAIEVAKKTRLRLLDQIRAILARAA
ncbi:YdcH family protein [Prosthecomicrobium sp. N25]|uniref:YdcH family protein n=1 Tax=Prosthecomicrobium sp. N25 TaxID=3129254 RepID=UPI003076AA2F